jgi:hypothetical protein
MMASIDVMKKRSYQTVNGKTKKRIDRMVESEGKGP